MRETVVSSMFWLAIGAIVSLYFVLVMFTQDNPNANLPPIRPSEICSLK